MMLVYSLHTDISDVSMCFQGIQKYSDDEKDLINKYIIESQFNDPKLNVYESMYALDYFCHSILGKMNQQSKFPQNFQEIMYRSHQYYKIDMKQFDSKQYLEDLPKQIHGHYYFQKKIALYQQAINDKLMQNSLYTKDIYHNVRPIDVYEFIIDNIHFHTCNLTVNYNNIKGKESFCYLLLLFAITNRLKLSGNNSIYKNIRSSIEYFSKYSISEFNASSQHIHQIYMCVEQYLYNGITNPLISDILNNNSHHKATPKVNNNYLFTDNQCCFIEQNDIFNENALKKQMNQIYNILAPKNNNTPEDTPVIKSKKNIFQDNAENFLAGTVIGTGIMGGYLYNDKQNQSFINKSKKIMNIKDKKYTSITKKENTDKQKLTLKKTKKKTTSNFEKNKETVNTKLGLNNASNSSTIHSNPFPQNNLN